MKQRQFQVNEKCKFDGVSFCCNDCSQIYKTKQAFISHYWRKHTESGKQHSPGIALKKWNETNIVSSNPAGAAISK